MRSEARASKKRAAAAFGACAQKEGSLREHVDDEQPGLLAASFAHSRFLVGQYQSPKDFILFGGCTTYMYTCTTLSVVDLPKGSIVESLAYSASCRVCPSIEKEFQPTVANHSSISIFKPSNQAFGSPCQGT